MSHTIEKPIQPSGKNSKFYSDKIVLAPMVRENQLPFRLLCLEYGADLVYTEELIDHRLCSCTRIENKVLGTVDFIDSRGKPVLRTCATERDRLILQLGSNNPDRALRAAKLALNDIAGLDFNFGCPKSFSLSGGMGAALLTQPDQIKTLLTKCVENLNIPVTCKIRLLPELDETLKLVKLIESCGVSAIAVHGRTKDQRSSHENQDDHIRAIVESVSIPVIANGGSNHIKSYSDIIKFRERTGASSVMLARAAMKNPSIFRSDNVLEPGKKVICEYLKLAIKYDNYVHNSKYSIQTMISASHHFDSEFVREFQRKTSNDYETLCKLFGLSDWYEENRLTTSESQ